MLNNILIKHFVLLVLILSSSASMGLAQEIILTPGCFDCDDNGTIDRPEDDEFYIDIKITHSDENIGSSWTSNIEGKSGEYGDEVTFGPFKISDGDVRIEIKDALHETSVKDTIIEAPISCSSSDCSSIEQVVVSAGVDLGIQKGNTITNTTALVINPLNIGSPFSSHWSPSETIDKPCQRRNSEFYPDTTTTYTLTVTNAYGCAKSDEFTIYVTDNDSEDCQIIANVLDAEYDDKGTEDESDDEYWADVMIVSVNNPTGSGWTTSDDHSGIYGLRKTLGPYPVDKGDTSITVFDKDIAGCSVGLVLKSPKKNCIDVTIQSIQVDPRGTYNNTADDELYVYAQVEENEGQVSWVSDQGFVGLYDQLNLIGPLSSTAQETIIIRDADNELCNTELIVDPISAGEGIWPGDCNRDQEVNNLDILNLGYAYGAVGIPRSYATLAWRGQSAMDWEQVTPESTIDFKHVDNNGDGQINLNDTLAIRTNWALYHTYDNEIEETLPSEDGGTPFYLDADILEEGQSVSIPIVLGSSAFEAQNVFALAFTIAYNPEVIAGENFYLDFSDSWLGVRNEDFIALKKIFPNEGKIEIGIVRINGTPISGEGTVARIGIVGQDFILPQEVAPEKVTTDFAIEKVYLLDENEETIPVTTEATTVEIIAGVDNERLGHLVKVFPNPVKQNLHIQLNELNPLFLEVMDATGKQVFTQTQLGHTISLPVAHIPMGHYVMRLITEEGIITKRIAILK